MAEEAVGGVGRTADARLRCSVHPDGQHRYRVNHRPPRPDEGEMPIEASGTCACGVRHDVTFLVAVDVISGMATAPVESKPGSAPPCTGEQHVIAPFTVSAEVLGASHWVSLIGRCMRCGARGRASMMLKPSSEWRWSAE